MSVVPLLGDGNPAAVVAWRDGRAVHVAEFCRDVAVVAEQLPQRGYLVNLCVDRYRFAVGLAAALLRKQVSLLPPAHTPELLRSLVHTYAGLYALTDQPFASDVLEVRAYPTTSDRPLVVPFLGVDPVASPLLEFPPDQIAAIAFTSGSTGTPLPHPKSWGRLALGAVGEAQSLGLQDTRRAVLVGTVPPQHMYGLESTVLLALHNGQALHAGRPFYPADIRAALEEVDGERVLVTTPVHLRALLAEQATLPPLHSIVCATAPLSPEMAAEAEARYGAPLREIYGFTEAGMIASRRTTAGPTWHTLPGVRVWAEASQHKVGGGHVQADVAFSDLVDLQSEHAFVLQGRNADLVNIAGKRSSLAYLNQQLAAIAGVQDGVFLIPDEIPGHTARLAALVVAPALTRAALLSSLRERIDPAFLPRPLYFVRALPRNATGKLPRAALLQLLAECVAVRKKS